MIIITFKTWFLHGSEFVFATFDEAMMDVVCDPGFEDTELGTQLHATIAALSKKAAKKRMRE